LKNFSRCSQSFRICPSNNDVIKSFQFVFMIV
jgi:hypothetical protein